MARWKDIDWGFGGISLFPQLLKKVEGRRNKTKEEG